MVKGQGLPGKVGTGVAYVNGHGDYDMGGLPFPALARVALGSEEQLSWSPDERSWPGLCSVTKANPSGQDEEEVLDEDIVVQDQILNPTEESSSPPAKKRKKSRFQFTLLE